LDLITGKTATTGVIGNPIAHTMSPAIHNAAFAYLGLDYVYLPFRVLPEELEAAIGGAKALNFVGLNVTIPHKKAVIPLLDELSPEAEILGTVNTIHYRDGKAIGHNTDGIGFMRALQEEAGCEPKKKVVTILGTGGATKAVAVQLALAGAVQLNIVGRDVEKAEIICMAIKRANPLCETNTCSIHDVKELENNLAKSHILVHATSVGMYPHQTQAPLVNRNMLHRGLLVCDLVYNPVVTGILKEAEAIGCQTLSGLGMLLYQGASAFSLWTGRDAPIEIMKKVLQANLKG
jgi:shikimate dehydrogenase